MRVTIERMCNGELWRYETAVREKPRELKNEVKSTGWSVEWITTIVSLTIRFWMSREYIYVYVCMYVYYFI